MRPYAVPHGARLPDQWARNYVVFERWTSDGKFVAHAGQMANGDAIIRRGYPHVRSVQDSTRAAQDHVHINKLGQVRDDSLGTAAEMGFDTSKRMGISRTRLSDRAFQRELQDRHAAVARTSGMTRDARVSVSTFSVQATDGLAAWHRTSSTAWRGQALLFERQSQDLASLMANVAQSRDILASMAKQAKGFGATTLTPRAAAALTTWNLSIAAAKSTAKTAESLTATALRLSDRAALKATAAAEATAIAAAAQAEWDAKMAAAAAERAAKDAARAAEESAKATAKAAEGAAKAAAKAAETSAKATAAALEATAKAGAAAAEATAKGIAFGLEATARGAAALGSAIMGG